MRKIYVTLLSCLFIVASINVNAQVNTYVFTAGTGGTLEDMSSGTTQLIGTGSDDGTSAVTNIGFSFTFAGTAYTQFSASANGLVALGPTAVTNQWDNNSTASGFMTAVSMPKLAAYYDDIATGTNGKVHYKLIGSSPTQKLVIEWRSTVPINTGGAFNATFQLWLEEGSNRVTFVYGSGLVVNGANGGYTVGLASSVTDFQSVTTSTNTSSIAVHNGTQTDAIPSGTTYSFTPPPPCVPGSLAGGTTQSSVAAACSVGFTLSVTGSSFGAGLTYQWESSATGLPGSWSNIGGATGPTYVATQSTATYYRRKISCTGTDQWSTGLQITQNPVTACYCTPVYTNNTEPITLVNFSNINNTTSPTVNGTPAFEDFTAIVGNVSKGQTYPITVKGNTDGGFTTQINAYIDWNQDGDFADAGESYYIGPIVNSTGTDAVQATANILIPVSSLDGITRMRVIKKYNAQAPACNTDGFGQAEDYSLSITTPACLAPSGLSVGTITTTSATVSFTVTGTAYVEYGPPGFTPGTGAVAGAGGTVVSGPSPVVLGGLTPNTLYDLYVRQDCGGGIFSGNAIGGNFRTLCNAIAAFPYTETFEAASPTRACWIPTIVSGTANWTYGAGAGNGGAITAAHGGTVNARHFGNGTGSIARLISPTLNFSAMNPALGAEVVFWYANQNWLGDQNQLRVYYKTSAGGTWTLIPGAVFTTNVGAWTEVTLALPGSTTSDYYIAFEGTELFGFGVAVDDVTIEQAPSCPKPTAVSATGISSTSMVVNFSSPGNAFIVEYGPVGFTPGTGATAGAGGTIAFGTASPITLAGLASNTTYDVYVRRVCDPGVDYSTNVKTLGSTLCAAANIPYLQNFESAVPNAGLPTCTSMEDVNGNSGPDGNVSGGRWTSFAGTSAQTYVSPTKVARYLYDFQVSTRGADDWLYMQGLNLTGGTSYRLKFYYKGSDGPTWVEGLEVKYGTQAYNASMTSTLFSNTNIITAIATPWDSAVVDFTPATTGVYYIGFHAISAPDQAFLYLDDVSVRVTPLVDVGATAIATPTCPAANGVLQATIKNYNITTENFATYPVTVTATITGTASTVLTTTINTGTLAPNATMTVSLPAFNFVTGAYNVTVATSSPNDPETGNDAFTKSFFVNPSPVVATVTPAAPVICANGIVQLNTQFITPPPAPVTLPAVSSGAISVVVPDATATGASHTLAVAGVPAGATVTGISVTLNMTHTWINDIVLNLKAPNGKVLNLFNREGAAFQTNITNLVVSSTATNPIPPAGAPFTGTYAADNIPGVGPTAFTSDAAGFSDLYSIGNGNWTLAGRDYVLFDQGTITSWSITITYGFPYPTTTWSPIAGLFTNAAATTAYTAGDNAFSVYAKPAGTTTYTVTTTNPLTGCASTSTVVVTVNPNPVLGLTNLPPRICLSDSLVSLSATPAGGTWSGIGVSGSNFVPPVTALGSYTLSYTYTNPTTNCTTTSTLVAKVESCPERIILLRDNAVILFPNPNNGQFNIRINSVLYNKLAMRVYSSAAGLVRTQQFSGLVFGRVIPIDLRALPAGTYMVQFSYDGGVRTSEKTFKVIVGH